MIRDSFYDEMEKIAARKILRPAIGAFGYVFYDELEKL
jgi:hypothetical protein